jgi:surface protein
MKKIIVLFLMILSTVSYSQTAITDTNIRQALSDWVSIPTFAEATYGNISEWDVSQVTDMSELFSGYDGFNEYIGYWNVSNVTTMSRMFSFSSSFNQDLSAWDVSNVTTMNEMFSSAQSFNQDIGSWDLSNVTDMNDFFQNTGISLSNFDATIIGWYNNATKVPNNITFSGNVAYCQSRDWLYVLETRFDWDIITDEDGDSTGFYLDCQIAGVNDQNLTNVSIYPNPVKDKLLIQGLSSSSKVSIYNVLGKLVLSQTISKEIDIKQFSKGIYTLKIIDGQKETSRNFIKY